jgi:hypothetical protein
VFTAGHLPGRPAKLNRHSGGEVSDLGQFIVFSVSLSSRRKEGSKASARPSIPPCVGMTKTRNEKNLDGKNADIKTRK